MRSKRGHCEIGWFNWECVVKRHFITYGDAAFAQAKQRLVRAAATTGEFDSVTAYGPEDVSEEIKSSELWRAKRGGGYWSWKPDVILSELQRAQDGDCIVYVDGGCEVVGGDEWKKYWRILSEKDLVVQKIYQVNRWWTRRSVVEEFSDLPPHWLDGCQFMATVIFLKKTPMTVGLASDRRRYMIERPDLIRDVTADERREEHPEFRENRHDQTVFTALVNRLLVNPELRKLIHVQWEHVENLSPFRSQVVRAMRNRELNGVSLSRKMREMVLRIVKTALRRPYFALLHGSLAGM